MRFIFNPSVLPKLNIAPFMVAEMGTRAEVIEQIARSIAPVKTGRYRDGLRASAEVEGGKATGRVASDVDYGLAIEFGTARTPTFAPLRRAAETVGGSSSLRRR